MLNLSPGAALLRFFVDTAIIAWALMTVYFMWDDIRTMKRFRKELDEKASNQT